MADRVILTTEEAVHVLADAMPPFGTERITPFYAGGRILGDDLLAENDYPPYRRSVRDGYAVRSADLSEAAPLTGKGLPEVGTNYAGVVNILELDSPKAVRIMTGGLVPSGADKVICFEHAERINGRVYMTVPSSESYIEAQGSVFRKGGILAQKGTVVDARTAEYAVSAGVGYLSVVKQPRIGLVVTGDELVMPGRPLPAGKIYSSHPAFLRNELLREGCILDETDILHAEDDPEKVSDAVKALAGTGVHLILTTGGTCIGDHDKMPEVMRRLNSKIMFHGIAHKAGKTTELMMIDDIPLMSLSGHPRAVEKICEAVIFPAIRICQGRTDDYIK